MASNDCNDAEAKLLVSSHLNLFALQGLATALSISLDWKEMKFYILFLTRIVVKRLRHTKWGKRCVAAFDGVARMFPLQGMGGRGQGGSTAEDLPSRLSCSCCHLNPAEVSQSLITVNSVINNLDLFRCLTPRIAGMFTAMCV